MNSFEYVILVTAVVFIADTSASRVYGMHEPSISRHPIILSGPLLGQKLQIKDVRKGTKCGNALYPFFRTAWVGSPVRLLCGLGREMRLNFSSKTHESSSLEGIEVRVAPGWAGLRITGNNFDPLLAYLEKAGYHKDVDLFPFPYDWRLTVRDWQLGTFQKYQELVESVWKSNEKNSVVLTGLSMAGSFTHAFLNWTTSSWRKKFIHAWVPIASAWNGAVNDFSALGGGVVITNANENTGFGVDFECKRCNPPLKKRLKPFVYVKNRLSRFAGPLLTGLGAELTNAMLSFPGMYFLLPGVDYSTKPPTDSKYLEVTSFGSSMSNSSSSKRASSHQSFKASQVHEYFSEILGDEQAGAMARYMLSVSTTTDPGVPVHCIYSYNLPTDKSVNISIHFNSTKEFHIELDNGDGTVPLKGSLDVCTRWKSTVKTYTVPGVTHRRLATVEQVADVLVAVAMEDTAAWKSWKSPNASNIRIMKKYGEVVVEDLSQNLFDRST